VGSQIPLGHDQLIQSEAMKAARGCRAASSVGEISFSCFKIDSDCALCAEVSLSSRGRNCFRTAARIVLKCSRHNDDVYFLCSSLLTD
jgi:hypothetical protein